MARFQAGRRGSGKSAWHWPVAARSRTGFRRHRCRSCRYARRKDGASKPRPMLVNAAAPLNGRAYVFTRPDTCYEFTMRWINSAGACLRAALCLVVVAAAPSYAVSIATLLPPPDTREIETTIERGHKLLLDEKYADASKAFDEVLQNGDFLQLTKGRQFRTLLLASQ